MKNILSAWLVGFLFALGLGISGMTQPLKVIGFLDLFGSWDPSLMFVMVGAILVHLILYWAIRKRSAPVFSMRWHVPEKTKITKSLIIGSLLFGIGWGLAGYCPGPALTSLASFQSRAFLFVGSMILGMFIFKLIDRKMNFDR